MKELDPLVFLSVFQEMLGFWLWLLLLAGALCAVALLALVVRERRLVSRRLIHAELLGLVGGGAALGLMAKVSSSGFTDAGGPADWLLIALVYGAGLMATIVLAYTALGWLSPRKSVAASRAEGR